MAAESDALNLRAIGRASLSLLAGWNVFPPILEPEHRLVGAFIRPGDTVIDIGANVGVYTLQLARAVGPSGQVLAFEPQPSLASIIRKLAKISGVTNVTVLEAALSSSVAPRFLSAPKRALGGRLDAMVHLTDQTEAGSTRVTTTTLDEAVKSLGITATTFVKCDVEGAEWDVLSGGRTLLSKSHPAILCEIEGRWCKRFGVEETQAVSLISELIGGRALVYEGSRLIDRHRSRAAHSNTIFIPRDYDRPLPMLTSVTSPSQEYELHYDR